MSNKTKTSLNDLKDRHCGVIGSPDRDRLDKGYETFKIGVLLQEARKRSGLTQQELADKGGTTKSYISKIENNVKEVRI